METPPAPCHSWPQVSHTTRGCATPIQLTRYVSCDLRIEPRINVCWSAACVCVAERPWVCGMTGSAEANHLDLCFRAFVELHTFEVGATPGAGREIRCYAAAV